MSRSLRWVVCACFLGALVIYAYDFDAVLASKFGCVSAFFHFFFALFFLFLSSCLLVVLRILLSYCALGGLHAESRLGVRVLFL